MHSNAPNFVVVFTAVVAIWSSSAISQGLNLGGTGGGLEPLLETVEGLSIGLGDGLGLNNLVDEGRPVNNLLDELDTGTPAGGTSESDDNAAILATTSSGAATSANEGLISESAEEMSEAPGTDTRMKFNADERAERREFNSEQHADRRDFNTEERAKRLAFVDQNRGLPRAQRHEALREFNGAERLERAQFNRAERLEGVQFNNDERLERAQFINDKRVEHAQPDQTP